MKKRTKRTIMIFPNLKNINIIQDIRKKYDPLSGLVRPHITLVFPFESNIVDEEIRSHLYDKMKNINPFKIELNGITKEIDTYGNYLFLNIKEGKEKIDNLHDILYTGFLKQYKMGYAYNPHMTIGKLKSADELCRAYDDVCDINIKETIVVNKICVEYIGEHDESIIDMEYLLKVNKS